MDTKKPAELSPCGLSGLQRTILVSPRKNFGGWEEVNWSKVFLFTKTPVKGVKKNSVIVNEPLDKNFIEFAKSYVLYHYMNGGKKINQRLNIVFRTIKAALLQVNGRSHIQYVNLTVLDQCVVTLKSKYTKAVAHACGKVLEGLVSFLREKNS